MADLISAGSVIVPDKSLERQAEIRMFSLLAETGAQRALFAKFENGERVGITAVAQGGVAPITQANRIVSIREEHYFEMYKAHLLGDCWDYRTKHNSEASALEIGMVAIGAELLLSCPIQIEYATVAAISISFDQNTISPELAYPAMRRAADDLAEAMQGQ